MADGSKNRGRYKSKGEYVDERRVKMKQAGGRILYVVLDRETNAKMGKVMENYSLDSAAAAVRFMVERTHSEMR